LVAELNRVFMDVVNDSPQLFADVSPALAGLRDRGVALAILTNGPSDGQRRKLQATGLHRLVDQVAIGEEIGCSKPTPAAFHRVADRFPCRRQEACMVGDSPELDYDGALRAGLDALLLDRHDRHGRLGKGVIRGLEELLLR
jgi:HAD superfamily hydrolase (TIGR01549 family)